MARRLLPWRTLIEPGCHWSWLSIVLYGIACLLPAIPPIFSDLPIRGWVCVASLMYTLPAWWANPAYFLSLILYAVRRRRAATIVAGLAAILACSFELMGIPQDGLVKSLAQQEVGCYVWIISLQIHALNLIWLEWLNWRQRRESLESESLQCNS
jgi:hypothetical protein